MLIASNHVGSCWSVQPGLALQLFISGGTLWFSLLASCFRNAKEGSDFLDRLTKRLAFWNPLGFFCGHALDCRASENDAPLIVGKHSRIVRLNLAVCAFDCELLPYMGRNLDRINRCCLGSRWGARIKQLLDRFCKPFLVALVELREDSLDLADPRFLLFGLGNIGCR